jgi:hypothetical protein
MKKFQIFIILLTLCIYASCCDKEEVSSTKCEKNCALEPEVGPCNAAIPKYYFDKTEKKCKQFIWGGCAGVVPFETLEECESCGCK